MNPRHLVISCSLNPDSKSRALAAALHDALRQRDAASEMVDLRNWPLPFCDGDACYGDANVQGLSRKIRDAGCIVLSVPIYNYDVSAAAKNLVELAGGALENKIIGFLCAAGGQGSYMSVMPFANSLMLDFRCLVLPRFVYATGGAFDASGLRDAEIRRRVEELADEAVRVTNALHRNGAGSSDLP